MRYAKSFKKLERISIRSSFIINFIYLQYQSPFFPQFGDYERDVRRRAGKFKETRGVSGGICGGMERADHLAGAPQENYHFYFWNEGQ